MSFLTSQPDTRAAAAGYLVEIGSVISGGNAGAAPPTTGALTPALAVNAAASHLSREGASAMDFAMSLAKLNVPRISTGPGSALSLAAAARWDALAAALYSAAASYGSIAWGLTDGPLSGPAAASLAATVTPYVAWMNTTAHQAERVATQARAAAGAYRAR
jgi:hypothetical protein